MMTMNLEQFSSLSQDELIDWANDKASAVVGGELSISDEASVTSDDLIFALAIYKMLAEKNLAIKSADYKTFIVQAEAELRRRNEA